jgi:saccharopine dehydrogenase-like NADP-dependent oxidoreductase
MTTIVALGCGLVGEFVVQRLADDGHSVIAIDLQLPDSIKKSPDIKSIEMDAEEYIKSLDGNEIIINMLPGRIGHGIRHSLVTGGHNIVDLAFTAEDPQEYDQLAKEHGSTMIWDIGIAPGLSNMLLAHAQRELGFLEKATIHVGGNPTVS